jgi:hypothetical protein
MRRVDPSSRVRHQQQRGGNAAASSFSGTRKPALHYAIEVGAELEVIRLLVEGREEEEEEEEALSERDGTTG